MSTTGLDTQECRLCGDQPRPWECLSDGLYPGCWRQEHRDRLRADGGKDIALFWAGAPLTVRSDLFHIYREETGRSLCGKYHHAGLNAKQPVEEGDTWTDGGDCKACCRKADPVEVDDGE